MPEQEDCKVEYTKLGHTDIEIPKVCVGCMSFGKAGTMHDWTLDEAATEEVVKHALELGINFLTKPTVTLLESARNTWARHCGKMSAAIKW